MEDTLAVKTEYKPSPARVFLYGMLVPGLILVCAYAVIGIWPFGSTLILEVDSIHQYLPFITELRRHFVEQESLFYSFSGGLGFNLWANLAYYGASPLNYLTVLIPEAAVCDYLVWLILLRLALCGGTFSWYLFRRQHGSALTAVIFGTAYALSNFFLGYKFNLMWLESMAMAPLIMYGIEVLLEEGRSGVYIFALFYALWNNFYIGYILCLFSCLWFLFRLLLLENLTWGTALRRAGKFALASICAGGMSAVLLLPAAMALSAGDSLSRSKLFEELFYNNGLSMLFAHLEDSAVLRTSYERGDAQLYCGIIVLPLLAMYGADPALRLKERLMSLGFLALFLFSFTFAPFNYVWHGFHLQTGLPNRFAFLYMLLLLAMCRSALGNISALSFRRFLLCAVPVFLLYGAVSVYKLISAGEWRLFVSLVLLAAYLLLLALLRSAPPRRRVLTALLCLLMLLEAGSHAMSDLVNKGGYDKHFYTAYQQDLTRLLSEREDAGEYYRSEVDSQSIVNFSLYAGGNGIALFDSSIRGDYRLMMKAFGLRSNLNTVRFQGQTKLVNDILGLRYYVSTKQSSDTLNGFEKLGSLNGKNLYFNPDALSVGFMVPESVLEWDGLKGTGMDSHNQFARLVSGVEQLFQPQYSFKPREGKTYVFDIPDGGMAYAKFDRSPTKIEWTTPEYSAILEAQNYFLEAASTGPGQQAKLRVGELGEGSFTLRSWTCSQADYSRFINALSRNQLREVSAGDARLSGVVEADESGILLITLPWDEGWSLSVDGEARELLKVGGALMGVRLEPGEHVISMSFVPRGFSAGLVISACSVLSAMSMLICEFLARKQNSIRAKYNMEEQ